MDWHKGGDDDGFPIFNTNWGVEGEIDQDALTFIGAEYVDFSINAVKQVVQDENKLVEQYTDVRLAASRFGKFTRRSSQI